MTWKMEEFDEALEVEKELEEDSSSSRNYDSSEDDDFPLLQNARKKFHLQLPPRSLAS